jgi:succinate dehydrogenase / fumarate reductase cytochrome b subunit
VATPTDVSPHLVEHAKAAHTTIALKILMAVTGAIFVGYVLLHMYGNLMAFGGADVYNTYAHHLRTFLMPMLPYQGFLWVLRLVLVLALVGHVFAAFTLWNRAQKARTTRYAVKKAVAATLSAKWMRWGGVALLAFVVFHLLEFTTRTITPGGDSDSPFTRLTNGFSLWWVFLIYLVAMFALAMHLHHGIWSAAQTLGWTSSALSRRVAKTLGLTIALVVSVGFIVPPFLILVGVIK